MPVTLDILQQLAEKLVDIHSQFETSNLFSEGYQFKIVDGLSENKNLIESYQNDFSQYQKLKKNSKNSKINFRKVIKKAIINNFC